MSALKDLFCVFRYGYYVCCQTLLKENEYIFDLFYLFCLLKTWKMEIKSRYGKPIVLQAKIPVI